jgi:hypothetical protein
MKTKTFPCTPAQLATLRTQLATVKDVKLTEDGNTGTITFSDYNVTLSYSYDGTANLTLTIEHEAWYETDSMIWGKVSQYMPA